MTTAAAAAHHEHHHWPRSVRESFIKRQTTKLKNVVRVYHRHHHCHLTRPQKKQKRGLFPSSSMPLDTESEHCIIIVGVSRSKLAALLFSVMLISLFLTVHIIYDSALYIQASTTLSDNRMAILTRDKQVLQLSDQKISYPHHIHFPKTSRKLPQCLIIGVRKCGTRALLEMLNLHPRIQKAAGEVHFFDRDENYIKGLNWYKNKMPNTFKGQITIEKSPSYFVTSEVPERVRAMNSSIKLLLIVREPVTRAISDYTQLKSHSTSPSLLSASTTTSINQPTMQQQQSNNSLPTVAKSFEELSSFPNGTVNTLYRPLVLSLYHQYIIRWLEIFPREQLLLVNGDLLIDDPLSQIRKIEDFLGVDHRISQNNFYFNETKGFYCLRTDMGESKCLRETKGRRHPTVDPRVISRLRKFFAEHNQKFYELIGEDLGWPEE